jgi:hypothetical protein
MEIQLTSFLIALFTTLVTITVTKYFEFRAVNKQHELDLKKAYLDKKLSASESIMYGLNVMLSTYIQLKFYIEGVMKSSDGDVTASIVESLHKTVNEQLQKLNNIPEKSWCILLYYDIDKTYKQLNSLGTEIFDIMFKFDEEIKKDNLDQHSKLMVQKINEVISIIDVVIAHVRTNSKNFEL